MSEIHVILSLCHSDTHPWHYIFLLNVYLSIFTHNQPSCFLFEGWCKLRWTAQQWWICKLEISVCHLNISVVQTSHMRGLASHRLPIDNRKLLEISSFWSHINVYEQFCKNMHYSQIFRSGLKNIFWYLIVFKNSKNSY